MGNQVACSQPKPKYIPKKKKQPETKNQAQISEINSQKQNQIPSDKNNLSTAQKLPVEPSPKVEQSSNTQNSKYCMIHKTENIRAVCITNNCPLRLMKGQSTSRILCTECLIEHTCPNKLRLSEFITRLRSKLSKETLDVFMEIFDDQNQVKIDTEKLVWTTYETVLQKLLELIEKALPEFLQLFFIQQSDLKKIAINQNAVQGLLQLIEGGVSNGRIDSIELAVTFINDPKLSERLCEQLEKHKLKVGSFLNDFNTKYQILLKKYLTSVQFLFKMFSSQADYLLDEDTIKSKKGAQVVVAAKNLKKEEEQKKTPVAVVDRTIKMKEKGKRKHIYEEKEEQYPLCEVHKQEIIAICTTPNCKNEQRKLCADCLIANTDCTQRMRINEFVARVNRALNKEVIEELLIPWAEESFLPSLRKQLLEGCDLLKQIYDGIVNQELRNLYVQFYLIQQALPQDLQEFLSKEYINQFCGMIIERQNFVQFFKFNKQDFLGVQFLNDQSLIDKFLASIVKSEQVVPKKAERLQIKLTTISFLFIDHLQNIVDIFKNYFELNEISNQFKVYEEEKYSLEESIYKIKEDQNTFSEWQLQGQFSPMNNLSITDVCFLNESMIALSCFDGQIAIWNLGKQKLLTKLKHGSFVSSLISFNFRGKPILVSSGFSSEQGSSIAIWDLTQRKPAFELGSAHSDSIRRIKHISLNFQKTDVFNPLEYENNILSCSDDGTVKIFNINTNYELQGVLVLRQPGPSVLDFTLLNGQVLVCCCIDKSVQLSFPFTNVAPFQTVQDDSAVYCVQSVENKKNTFQRFITGNDKGIMKLYGWQNNRVIQQKVIYAHDDRINRIIFLQPGLVATCSNDKTLGIVLVQTGKTISRIKEHDNSVTSIEYVKELQALVSSDQSGKIFVWV